MGLLLSLSDRGREFLKGLWDVRWEGLPQGHCYSCEPVSWGTVLVAGQEEEGGAARGTGLEQEGKQASGMQARGHSHGGGGRRR